MIFCLLSLNALGSTTIKPLKEELDLLLKLFQLGHIKSLIPANIDQNLDTAVELQQRL